MKYKKKPIQVEAIQYKGNNIDEFAFRPVLDKMEKKAAASLPAPMSLDEIHAEMDRLHYYIVGVRHTVEEYVKPYNELIDKAYAEFQRLEQLKNTLYPPVADTPKV